MTVKTSVVPAVLDYLVTTFQAASTLSGVTVYDGPVTTAAAPQRVLWVGLQDPDSAAAPVGAESQQEWVGLGARQRNELLTVHCVAEAWGGATDVKAMRDAAYNIVAAVEVILQADPTFGGLVLHTDNTAVTRQLRQNNTSAGQVARVYFSIKAKARIGGV